MAIFLIRLPWDFTSSDGDIGRFAKTFEASCCDMSSSDSDSVDDEAESASEPTE